MPAPTVAAAELDMTAAHVGAPDAAGESQDITNPAAALMPRSPLPREHNRETPWKQLQLRSAHTASRT